MSTETTSQAKRAVRESVLLNPAPPERVFPLLCPVREADWLPQWKYRLVYSQSGVAELGCVFTTPNEDGPETTWIIMHHDPAKFEVAFAWVRPQMLAARLEIWLSPAGQGKTSARWRYTFTALSPAGERELEVMSAAWFEGRMRRLEKAMNHYLEHGAIATGPEWESMALWRPKAEQRG